MKRQDCKKAKATKHLCQECYDDIIPNYLMYSKSD